MIENEKKTHFATTVYGWICNIQNRFIGLEGMSMLYSTHLDFITYIMEEVDNSTFEEYKERCTLLMNRHAIARNDIYDGAYCATSLDGDGLPIVVHAHEDSPSWVEVSREEKDIRSLLSAWIHEEE